MMSIFSVIWSVDLREISGFGGGGFSQSHLSKLNIEFRLPALHPNVQRVDADKQHVLT